MESQMPARGSRETAELFLRNLSSEVSEDSAHDFLHPNYVGHVAPFRDDQGPAGYRAFAARTRVRYSDPRFNDDDFIVTEDKVVIRGAFTGTYRSHDEMDQVFDGQPVTMPFIMILHIAEGKVTESWISIDLVGLMQRWGVIPDFLGISREKKNFRVLVGGKELPTTEPVKVFWGDTELSWPLIPSEERMALLLWPWRW